MQNHNGSKPNSIMIGRQDRHVDEGDLDEVQKKADEKIRPITMASTTIVEYSARPPRKSRTSVSPPSPRKTRPKAAAPHRMMKTMQVRRMVVIMTSRRMPMLNCFQGGKKQGAHGAHRRGLGGRGDSGKHGTQDRHHQKQRGQQGFAHPDGSLRRAMAASSARGSAGPTRAE